LADGACVIKRGGDVTVMEFRLGAEQRVCGSGDVAVIPAGAEHTAELQRSFLRHPGLAHAAMFVWDSFRLDATKQPLPFYCQEISNVYRMRAPNRRNGVRRFCSAGR
jgi:hypothetical protein